MDESKTQLLNTVRQHLEGDAFFTGFAIAGKKAPCPAPTPVQNTHPHPREEAVPDQDMTILTETIRTCRKCPLSQTRTHAVPGEGNPAARLIFVGEAPGADEDTQGRPFVGRAGQLLDKIITACGLSRNDVFIANTLKCRPPGNRDPHPQEIDCCLAYLSRQIEIIQPEIIVALGAHAARTLVGSDHTIGRLRGHFHPCAIIPAQQSVRIMPTYHPAYLLRNYTQENRRCVWEDMKKVLNELDLPVPTN